MKHKLQKFVDSQSELQKEIGESVRVYMRSSCTLAELEALDEQFIFNNPEDSYDRS